jgi:TonB family protein
MIDMRLAAVAATAFAIGAHAAAGGAFAPAQLRSGALPSLPAQAVGGGEVFVSLSVDADGRVVSAVPIRTTPPFTEPIVAAAQTWNFSAAEDLVPLDPDRADSPVTHVAAASHVLVATIVRPPTLLNGPTLGEPPRNVADAPEDVALPTTTVVPAYPPLARDGGIVLLEASVGPSGAVDAAAVIRSAPPFDEPARAALLQWRFRAARWRGQPVASFVYVIFGFPVPIVG